MGTTVRQLALDTSHSQENILGKGFKWPTKQFLRQLSQQSIEEKADFLTVESNAD